MEIPTLQVGGGIAVGGRRGSGGRAGRQACCYADGQQGGGNFLDRGHGRAFERDPGVGGPGAALTAAGGPLSGRIELVQRCSAQSMGCRQYVGEDNISSDARLHIKADGDRYATEMGPGLRRSAPPGPVAVNVRAVAAVAGVAEALGGVAAEVEQQRLAVLRRAGLRRSSSSVRIRSAGPSPTRRHAVLQRGLRFGHVQVPVGASCDRHGWGRFAEDRVHQSAASSGPPRTRRLQPLADPAPLESASV